MASMTPALRPAGQIWFQLPLATKLLWSALRSGMAGIHPSSSVLNGKRPQSVTSSTTMLISLASRSTLLEFRKVVWSLVQSLRDVLTWTSTCCLHSALLTVVSVFITSATNGTARSPTTFSAISLNWSGSRTGLLPLTTSDPGSGSTNFTTTQSSCLNWTTRRKSKMRDIRPASAPWTTSDCGCGTKIEPLCPVSQNGSDDGTITEMINLLCNKTCIRRIGLAWRRSMKVTDCISILVLVLICISKSTWSLTIWPLFSSAKLQLLQNCDRTRNGEKNYRSNMSTSLWLQNFNFSFRPLIIKNILFSGHQ